MYIFKVFITYVSLGIIINGTRCYDFFFYKDMGLIHIVITVMIQWFVYLEQELKAELLVLVTQKVAKLSNKALLLH